MISEGKFREDLYYRLNVIPLQIPPLRQRHGDLEWLSKYFIALVCEENKKSIKVLSPEALAKIKSWRWPGNVRELQNVMERSVLLCSSDSLSQDDILIKDYKPNQNGIEFQPGLTVAELEKRLILKTLDYTNQNRTQAAHLLGISIRTLRNKIREYKVESLNQPLNLGESL
jgi:transcriptional regulator with PAS, ATPase and Fis domain